MKWKKLGLVFSPKNEYPWMASHAANPVSLHLSGDLYRVYFASRDDKNRSHIGFVEIDITNPLEILDMSTNPVMAPGPLGFFDDHGVYASSIISNNGNLWMYYTGWNPGPYPMYYPSVGVAVSDDSGKSFKRLRNSPILARTEVDPWMISQPCVIKDGTIFKMWYISGIKWEHDKDEDLHSYYDVKYGESEDGLNWSRDGEISLALENKERNIARPCVIKHGENFKAWYPVNYGEGYRIGYAESLNGRSWNRIDSEIGLQPSKSGWDSDAVTYPWVIVHKGRHYMFYNGNGFGRDGFGIAVEA